MKVYLNGTLIDQSQMVLSYQNRAFMYGDGLFETMVANEGSVLHLARHIFRLKNGLNAFSINPPFELELDQLQKIIRQLYAENKLTGFARLKIICWRKEGGTYSPLNPEGEILITIQPMGPPKTKTIKSVSFCESVRNQESVFSRYKTTNALKYVLAGIEMKKKKLEDIVLLDEYGNVSECLISNIFWIKDGKWFTSSLKTGCIEGTSRMVILDTLTDENIPFEEMICQSEELLNADSVFSCNASGIQHILSINGSTFEVDKTIERIYRPY